MKKIVSLLVFLRAIALPKRLHPVHHDIAVDADESPFAVDRQVQAFKHPSAEQDIWGIGEYEGVHDDITFFPPDFQRPRHREFPSWPSARVASP